MPRNQFQRMIFALITVVITVHAYVFYSLYVVNGNTLIALTGEPCRRLKTAQLLLKVLAITVPSIETSVGNKCSACYYFHEGGEEFAKNNFKSYIKIDFASAPKDVLETFDDIASLDIFFLRLQTATGVTLYPGESVIIFDEIQRAPLVRQAIKYLVADGRYSYIETGSLISCCPSN